MSSRDPEAGPSPRYSQDVEMEREDAGADSSAEFETSIETDGAGAGKRKRIRVPISAEQSTALHGLLIRTSFPTTEEREQLAIQLGMAPRRVQVWFQNQRQTQKRAARDREPSFSEELPVQSFEEYSLPSAVSPPTQHPPPEARHPSTRDEGSSEAAVRQSARAGNLFPLVNPPRSRSSLPQLPPSPPTDSSWSRGPALAPMSTPLEWNEFSQQGIFSSSGAGPGSPMDVDAESIRTVSSGSSRGGRSTSSGPNRGSVTLPPLSSVLGSGRSQFAPSTSSANSEYGSAHSRSPRNSISSFSSSRPSIAPTVASSRHSNPSTTASIRTGTTHSSLSPPQSIFQHPGHRTRPLSDLLTLPKFSRLLRIGSSTPPISVGGGPHRANSNNILDAALATSASWPRQARPPPPSPASRSVDVLDAAMSRRGSVSATASMQYRNEQRESTETFLGDRQAAGESVQERPLISLDERRETRPGAGRKTSYFPAVGNGAKGGATVDIVPTERV